MIDSQFNFVKHIRVSNDDPFALAEILQSHGLRNGFHKTANDLPEEIQEEISKIKPEKGKIILLIAPLGMGEFWGPNSRGDFFPGSGLMNPGMNWGFETFLNGNMFQHHINKDPRLGFGKMISSKIDQPMKRVVVISSIDVKSARKKGAGKFIDDIENGELPEVSMGCKVPHDVCSICGNKAKTTKLYCKHLKPGKILKIDPETEKIACAINYQPNFFDLSFVHKGADRSSGTLMKIAGDTNPTHFVMPSGYQAIVDWNNLQQADIKVASASDEYEDLVIEAFEKFAETQQHPVHDVLSEGHAALDMDELILKEHLQKVAAHPWGDIFGSFWSQAIPLKREEIQFIALTKLGAGGPAVRCYERDEVIPLHHFNRFDFAESGLSATPELLKIADAYFETRTIMQPFLHNRLNVRPLEKFATQIGDIDAATIAAGTTSLYAMVSRLVEQADMPSLMKIFKRNPALLAAMGLGSFAAAKFGGALHSFPVLRKDQITRGPMKMASDQEKTAAASRIIGKLISSSMKKDVEATAKAAAKKILGKKKDIAATGILTSAFLGFLSAAKDQRNAHVKHPAIQDVKGVEKFLLEHPFFSTAAMATAANLLSRKGIFKFRRPHVLEKNSNDPLFVNVLLRNEGKTDVYLLNNRSWDLLKTQEGK
jgi:hypothetical protein